MRNLFFTTSLFMLTWSLFGQYDEPKNSVQYLFGQGNAKITGFGGFTSQFGMARGNFAYYSGGMGAVLIDYKFYIGGFGAGIGEDLKFDDIYSDNGNLQYDKLRATMGLGGLVVGYSFNHEKPIHFASSMKLGVGSLAVYPKDFMTDELTHIYSDVVGMVEPELLIEFNLFRWWKIQTGVSYRLVFNIDDNKYFNSNGESVSYFKNTDFNTPCIGFNMIFGIFGPRESAK